MQTKVEFPFVFFYLFPKKAFRNAKVNTVMHLMMLRNKKKRIFVLIIQTGQNSFQSREPNLFLKFDQRYFFTPRNQIHYFIQSTKYTGVSVSKLFGYYDPTPFGDSLFKQILSKLVRIPRLPHPVQIQMRLGIQILIALI